MTRPIQSLVLALAVGMVAAPVQAQVKVETMSATEIMEPAPVLPEVAFDTLPLTETALKAQAGREDIALVAKSESTATVTRNSIGANSQTGEIGVTDQAFQNLSGLSLININSGNNVAINSSMNVNISITPGQ